MQTDFRNSNAGCEDAVAMAHGRQTVRNDEAAFAVMFWDLN
jgi:hypothetical protein